MGHFFASKNLQEDDEEEIYPRNENQRILAETIHGGDLSNMKILSYQNKAPAPPEGYMNPLKVMYSQTKSASAVKGSSRYIPQSPERILDAPDVIDDYCKFILFLVHIYIQLLMAITNIFSALLIL